MSEPSPPERALGARATPYFVPQQARIASPNPAIGIYHGGALAQDWLHRHHGQPWQLACVLGFTETALIPGISAAGKTPEDRRRTAIADAEFFYHGLGPSPSQALPPLSAGLSPVLITRSLVEATGVTATLVNAGLAQPLGVPALNLQGQAARCLSRGSALPLTQVQRLFEQGLSLGESQVLPPGGYGVIGECVVGGTTTALGLLLGLGIAAQGRVNSSHDICNHDQKIALVQQGLSQAGLWHSNPDGDRRDDPRDHPCDPLAVVAAVGDPMQPVVAGWAIALSRRHGVLLAGGTQMLAVYALAAALGQHYGLGWRPEQVAIGTTRWVAEDPSGDTPGLAVAIGQWQRQSPIYSSKMQAGVESEPILLGSLLNFQHSRHKDLRAYEAGFVKEGVAAGGCAIASSLSQGYSATQLSQQVDRFVDRYYAWRYYAWRN